MAAFATGFDELIDGERGGCFDDRIDFVFPATHWQYRPKPEVYIGVYNSRADGQPVSFTLQMRESSSKACCDRDMKALTEVFEAVHQGTDAHETSELERDAKDL